MPLSAEEDEFVGVASNALPRIAEIIAAFPAENRAGALKVAERRYLQAARDYGFTQAETERWVAAIMRKLRTRVEEKSMGAGKLTDLRCLPTLQGNRTRRTTGLPRNASAALLKFSVGELSGSRIKWCCDASKAAPQSFSREPARCY